MLKPFWLKAFVLKAFVLSIFGHPFPEGARTTWDLRGSVYVATFFSLLEGASYYLRTSAEFRYRGLRFLPWYLGLKKGSQGFNKKMTEDKRKLV